jgi:nucleotide-binding universal stress UspA family protein
MIQGQQTIRKQQTTGSAGTAFVTTSIPERKVLLDRILVTTDFSPASDRALEYALSVARHYGSHLYVAHIVTLDDYPLMAPDLAVARETKYRQEAKHSMGKLVGTGRFLGVPHDLLIEEGALWPAIHNLIERYAIQLVVAGTRKMGSIQKVVLGSNAEQMFRQASIPMLTVGPAAPAEPLYEAEFKHILFATDFGPGAEKEAAFALSLAVEHRSKLTVLHVLTVSQEATGIDEELSLRQMKELVPDTQGEHCLVKYRVVLGKPVDEILRVRQDTRADLIVMGARKRMSLAGHVPHTTAFEVVTMAPCPVLTVRS